MPRSGVPGLARSFTAYTGESVIRVFFITAATFAATSLTGYLCKRNLGPAGAFLAVATWGLLIALLTNIFFLQSENFHLILSLVVILVFASLTACDTQAIADVLTRLQSTRRRNAMRFWALSCSTVISLSSSPG